MGAVLEVTSATFTPEVLEESFERPVLVDFFAQWCGPCQMLRPLLEKLAQEYDFVLAKVDIDENPELANAYGIEGVPDVRIVSQGQVQPGFVGVLPEPELRELLAGLGLTSKLEQTLSDLDTAEQSGDSQQIQRQLEQALAAFPTSPELLLRATQIMIAQGNLDRATELIGSVDFKNRTHGDRAEALKGVIELHRDGQAISPETPSDTLYLEGCQAVAAADHARALSAFLALVESDRSYRKDAGRRAMLTVFKLLGDAHFLTLDYRKRLMQAMY